MRNTVTKFKRKLSPVNPLSSRRFATAVADIAGSAWEQLESRQMMSATPLVGAALLAYNPAHASATVEFPFVTGAKLGSATPSSATVVGAGWQNSPISNQSTPFELTFDATPSQQGVDTVVGLSNGSAGAWTSLAAIVRFNDNNQIDVRNGSGYQSDTTVNYTAGTTYHFELTVDPTNHTYSVSVTPNGGAQTLIASNYAFRSEQASTSMVNTLSGFSTVGSATVDNVVVTPLAQSVSSDWTNTAVASQSGTFELDFDATPGAQGIDSVVGLSNGNANAYTDLAAIVRFNSSNQIDARDGNSYGSETTVDYVAGTTYHFRMVVDTADNTYSVYVTPSGGSEITLANGFSFRSEQAGVTSLDTVGTFSLTGQTNVVNLSVTPVQTVSVAPSAPVITAKAASTTEIDLSWAPVANSAGYTIMRSTDGVNFTTVTSVAGNVNSFNDTGLTASTKYSYEVSAFNSAGRSDWSNIVSQSSQSSQSSQGSTPVSNAKPGPDNTGPTNPSILKQVGSMTITTPNTHLSNLAITGTLTIEAEGCTIDNFTINANGGYYGIKVADSGASLVATNGTITNSIGGGMFGQNYTAQYVCIHDVQSDAFDGGSNTSILNCYVYNIGMTQAHADGFQAVNGDNIVIKGNFFDIPSHTVIDGQPYTVNSCVFLEPPGSFSISNVTISDNWLEGGNYAIYAAGDTNVSVTNNVFGTVNENTGEQYGYIYQGFGSLAVFAHNVDVNGNAL